MAYKPGDIVIAPFSHTDLTEGKNRPILLLASLPNYIGDWLACMITSQLHHYTDGLDVVLSESDADFHSSSLKTSSLIRVTRLMVIAEDQMVGAIGEISPVRYEQVKLNLIGWLSLLSKG